MNERLYWLGFSVASGIGPITFNKLLDRFGSAKAAWEAPRRPLARIIGEKLFIKFDEFRGGFSIDAYERRLLKEGVSFLTIKDSEYPQLLKQTQKPPFVLYAKGSIEILRSTRNDSSAIQPTGRQQEQSKIIAVVGTRRTTQYGREVTRLFTQQLVDSGFVIVSGLAMGVDAIAHQTTLENKGKTIAVLGCGVDCCSPRENLPIYNSILQNGGCIISEVPLSHAPTMGLFPARNRIIMGLSCGVLVTEGAEDSGALITADYAFKNNRPVFAIPGPITSGMSKGPFKLIQKGAKLVTKVEDILQEFQISSNSWRIKSKISKKINLKGSTKDEQIILDLLQNEPLHFDQILRFGKFNSSTLGSILSLMEMKGFIKSLHFGMYEVEHS